MPKKRKFFKTGKNVGATKHGRKNDRTIRQHSLTKAVLTILAKTESPLTLNDIHKNLGELSPSKKDVEDAIAELVRRREVVADGKRSFRLDRQGNIFKGKVEKHPRGFGFITNLKPEKAADFSRDPYLSVRGMGTANHGDTVLIRVTSVRRDGRPEAELVAILERFAESITGYYKPGKPPRVVPEDPRYPSHISVIDSVEQVIPENHVVLITVLPQVSEEGFVRGRITEVLGSPQDIDVQMRMVIEKHDLPHVFPPEVEKEAAGLSMKGAQTKDRLDLRHILHVTIDGETAKDFDDAVAVEKTRGGYRLYVSIADVSHFVRPGGDLDKEAYLRGTSVYFPGRVIPMLPERLSNDLCSLVPDEDRLSFSAILDFDREGNLTSKKFGKSIIRSKQRFTYTTVKKILIDKDREARSSHKPFLTPLKWAEELARLLHEKRMARGSIGFNIPEPEIFLEEDGRIETIKRKERNFAHQIIEEFMLCANEAVAKTFSDRNREFVYRIHEKPSPEKVEEFASFAETLGIDLPDVTAEPEWFARVLGIVGNTPAEYVVNNLLLRTMPQARYDSENKGHFGLAASDYTHFTSPIRRYPDLMVHRFLQGLLNQETAVVQKKEDISLEEMTRHLSERERAAVTAERDIVDRLKMFFMERFVGETFEAVISGVSDNVLFIELMDLFVSGSIAISALTDDYYLYDEKRYRLIGEITAKTYQLGDVLSVTLVDVDRRRKRLNFAPEHLVRS